MRKISTVSGIISMEIMDDFFYYIDSY